MALPFASLFSQLICLVIILGAFDQTTAYVPPVRIPPNYISYPGINVAYKVHTETQTWAEARQSCINEGGHLAVIDTMQKVGYVAHLKSFNVYVWVGISRTYVNDPWSTAGSHTLMPHLPWAPGKPDGPHHCLAVRGCNRGLTNENCSSRLGFVCQVSLVDPGADQFGQIPIN